MGVRGEKVGDEDEDDVAADALCADDAVDRADGDF